MVSHVSSLSLADAVHPEGTPWILPRLDPGSFWCQVLVYLVGEAGSGACAGFLVGRTSTCYWWVGLCFVLLVGRAMSRDVFLGCCWLRMTLGNMFADEWDFFQLFSSLFVAHLVGMGLFDFNVKQAL